MKTPLTEKGSSKGITRITLAAIAALLFTTGSTMAGLPTPIDAKIARDYLDHLIVKSSTGTSGYSRSKFPHWVTLSGTCDTRETVLVRDGTGVDTDPQCRAVSGTWLSPYDNRNLASIGDVDIDHVVPLAVAWRSGASSWTTAQRRAFANDLTQPQLLAVSAAAVRAKGDKTPAEWMLPLQSFHCEYSRAYIQVKHSYSLAITADEKIALSKILDSC